MDVCCFVSQVFEVYEPLRLIYRNSDNETKLQVLQASLSCALTPKTVWKLYERRCRTLLTCVPPLGQVEELSHRCKHCFSGTVVKVLPHRIPGGKLSSLLPVLTYRAVGVDIRLLHVVRDPRASINSRIKLGWFPEFNDTKFTKMVEDYCNVITDNIEFGQNLDDSLKHRYKLVFYRDIAAHPLNTAKEIFTFAGMDLDENTLKWIKATTNLSNKTEANKANFKSPYSLVRNSKANIEKWRIESPPERTNAIEKICKPLLELIDELSMSENVHWITES